VESLEETPWDAQLERTTDPQVRCAVKTSLLDVVRGEHPHLVLTLDCSTSHR